MKPSRTVLPAAAKAPFKGMNKPTRRAGGGRCRKRARGSGRAVARLCRGWRLSQSSRRSAFSATEKLCAMALRSAQISAAGPCLANSAACAGDASAVSRHNRSLMRLAAVFRRCDAGQRVHGLRDPSLALQGGHRCLRGPQLLKSRRRAGALRIGGCFLAVVHRRGRRRLRRFGLAGRQGGAQQQD